MPTVAQHFVQRGFPVSQPASEDGSRPAAPVVLMVSGGADSTALLVMACTSKLDIGDGRGAARIARERLHVLHVNHHLRGVASDDDERFVRDLCDRYGLPLCVEHASFSDLGGRNLEAAAREVRYAAARRYVRELCRQTGAVRSAARILTAHTASDRTETFFMNAIKGSGPAGLSSIPRRRNIIVRPLIDRTHAELTRYLELAGIGWREDETNDDTSYLRNFIRHRVVPAAAERNAHLERAIGATCDILGDEDAFMAQLAARALRTCVRRSQDGLVVLDAARLASSELAIARRMVRLAYKQLAPDERLEMRHVEAVLACVARGEGSLTLPAGVDARLEFNTLTLRTVAAREQLVAGWLTVPGTMPLANQMVIESRLVRVPRGDDPVRIAREGLEPLPTETASAPDRADHVVVYIDAAALGYAEADLALLDQDGGVPAEVLHARLWVDAPAAGDIMCPLGMHGRSKKLSDLLGEARVPVAERAGVPVVRTSPGGAVVWVGGIRLDERFKCTASSRLLIELSIHAPAAHL
ncbi:tRNA lysidine(34) synthetase TilS [Collinsella tanakaei]|uniref:tRNA lysidine(34) synthetase TilS n=1 Tax=Collinsella tanakaei TaxID=626935 RepID=UPI0025A434B7|nr:tRNA lysidine(34) synthetase TilS [Collinsella tanakaei]MDM8302281.1 tRNA lysidine(34) synthetase TilS [Collinsella tanakaei]